MFGKKKEKIEDLTAQLELKEREKEVLSHKLGNYEFLKNEGVEAIIDFDYQGLVAFEGYIHIISEIKIKDEMLNYCINIYKNAEIQKMFTVYRTKDDLLDSPLGNKKRNNIYLLTLDISKFIVMQLTSYKERMGSKCQITTENKLSFELDRLIEISED